MNNIAISVQNVSKCYQIYDNPKDRLKQFVSNKMNSVLGKSESKHYKEFWALKNISFDIKQGETVGIVGCNGSGKSTLLQIICGTLTPSNGSIKTNGRIAALLELGSGFNPEFSGRENVFMNAALLGLSKEEIDERYDDIVDFADIGDFINQPTKTYSSGMMVRLAFAVAINVDPQILIVDEALSVGDELFQRKCFSKIESIKKQGATILFVSHAGGTVIELCDKAVLLDSGECLAIGEPKPIVGKYQKLIYAPINKRSEIRKDIKTSLDILNSVAPMKVDSATVDEVLIQDGLNEQNTNLYFSEPFFDPNLMSTSSLSYESHGAFIESAEIHTIEGKKVNHLIRGENYFFKYQVRFQRTATNVSVGMLIKSLSGVAIGGSTSSHGSGNGMSVILQGQSIDVEFRFSCQLNPGTYFFNAGVEGAVGEHMTYLHRVLDICMFKVLPVEYNTVTCFVDFNCSVDIQKLTVPSQEKVLNNV